MHDVMSGVKLTYDDLRRLPEDHLRHELIDGEHYVAASPSPRHQLVVGNLYYALRTWLQEHSGGQVYLAPVDVVMSSHDVVVPGTCAPPSGPRARGRCRPDGRCRQCARDVPHAGTADSAGDAVCLVQVPS